MNHFLPEPLVMVLLIVVTRSVTTQMSLMAAWAQVPAYTSQASLTWSMGPWSARSLQLPSLHGRTVTVRPALCPPRLPTHLSLEMLQSMTVFLLVLMIINGSWMVEFTAGGPWFCCSFCRFLCTRFLKAICWRRSSWSWARFCFTSFRVTRPHSLWFPKTNCRLYSCVSLQSLVLNKKN